MALIDADWSAEWRRLQEERGRRDDPARWDARAQEYARSSRASPYVSAFLEYAGIRPGESVLDIGSGTGTLALPLARRGHRVWAVDFSVQMLAQLERQVAEEGLTDVTAVRASWEDDWDAAGVPVADVAIASRSISVLDLGAALRRLDAHARRRVCLSVIARGTYPGRRLAHEAVGRPTGEAHEFIYCLNILYQMGVRPEVRYIRHGRRREYGSRREAEDALRTIVAPADEREEALFERYLREHLTQTVNEHGDAVWRQDRQPAEEWAFIAWDKGA